MTGVKRWCRLLLAGLGMAFLLSGCGGSGGGDTDAPGATAPVLTAQPSDAQAVAGGEARFTAAAQGSGVTWAWQRSTDSGITWVAIANATTATLTLPAVTLADNNIRLRAVAASGSLQTISSAATLTVAVQVTPPAISVQIAPAQVVAGSSVTLAITATGTALQYQWQSSRDGNTWADLAGATAATLQLQNLALDANGTLYRVVVRNSEGSVNSSAVTLSVTAPLATPSFALQPQAASVTVPNTATFTVTATGQPTPTLQWQRSSNAGASYSDIAGATAASYTTPATTLADSGALFRVQASNSTGTTTSAAATLTVAAAQVAPVITTQPVDVSVPSDQTATWTAAANGVPAPTYQWQLSSDGGTSFANINGATSSSYSLVTAVADNGKRVRVLATNSQGTATSRAAVLTVAAPAGVLGRAWAPPQSLEENTTTRSVTLSDTAIDDQGRVTVVFRKSDGVRDVIYATHGSPNAAGVAPTWTAPVAIDLLRGSAVSNSPVHLSVTAAPGGDAVALWSHGAPCTTTTYDSRPAATCTYHYFAKYTAATGQWAAPELLTDMEAGEPYQVLLNDRGDLAFYGRTWISTPTRRFERVKGLFMRTATDSALRRQLTSDESNTLAYQKVEPHLDAAGNLLLAAELITGNAKTIVARRGTVATGISQDTVLETRNARLEKSRVGLNGQQVVLWALADGSLAVYGATSPTATEPFSLALAWGGVLGGESLTVDDDGQAVFGLGGRVRWTAATGWLPVEPAGGVFSFFDPLSNAAISRSGDAIQVDGVGMSTVYDQASRTAFPCPRFNAEGVGVRARISSQCHSSRLAAPSSVQKRYRLRLVAELLCCVAKPAQHAMHQSSCKHAARHESVGSVQKVTASRRRCVQRRQPHEPPGQVRQASTDPDSVNKGRHTMQELAYSKLPSLRYRATAIVPTLCLTACATNPPRPEAASAPAIDAGAAAARKAEPGCERPSTMSNQQKRQTGALIGTALGIFATAESGGSRTRHYAKGALGCALIGAL